MTNTRVNEFDTFSYETPADYLPGMKQRQGEENQGFEDAEVIAKMNDEQRLANAKIYGRVIDNTKSLSKTLASKFEEQRKEEEQRGQNRASMLALDIGATFIDKANWIAERQKLGEDHSSIGYIIWQAEQAGMNSADIAELEAMSNLDVVRFDEMLSWDHAANYKPNFFGADGIRARDANGNSKYYLDVDGTRVDWDNANQNQRIELMREFDESIGWTPISGFRTEFLELRGQSKLASVKAQILAESDGELRAKDNGIRIENNLKYIYSAARVGDFAEAIHRIENEEFNRFGDQYGKGGRQAIRALIKAKVGEMVANGDLSIGDVTLNNYTFPHKGTGKDETLKVFEEYKDWDSYMNQIQESANQVRASTEKQWSIGWTENIKKVAVENGKPITEELLAQLLPEYKQAFFETHGRQPTQQDIKNSGLLGLPTVEDKQDSEWVQTLEYLYRNSLPIKMEDYINIYDKKTREKWAKIAAETGGQGMDENTVSRRNGSTKTLAANIRSEFIGKNDYKSEELGRLESKLRSEYNVMWAEIKGSIPDTPDGPEKAHEVIMKRLEIKAKQGGWKGDAPVIEYDIEEGFGAKYLKSLDSGYTFIQQGKNNGQTPDETLNSGLLPGSDAQLKRVLAYAANPTQNRIPIYYHKIANNIKGMDYWDVANAQYKASQRANGVTNVKELPQTIQKQKLESLDPFWKNAIKNHGNPIRVERYKGYVEKVNFNEISLYEGATI